MGTKRKTYDFGDVIEREEFHDGRYGGPGRKRQKRKKPTKEQIEKRNQYNKEKKARHLLRKYFKKNDYFSTWTYRREDRPDDMAAAKSDYAKAVRYIRKEYRKRGCELRWIRNIEAGSKGAWHIHVVVNRIPDTDIILAKAWGHGKVWNELLYEAGNFRELAAYITKSGKTEPGLKESNYSTSRNMPPPIPSIKKMKRWQEEPKAKKGYYIDKETYYEGINPVTGCKYRHYTMIRLNRRI